MGARTKKPMRVAAAGLCLCAAGALCITMPAQKGANRDAAMKGRLIEGRFPAKPSIAPAWTIPVDALGFASPGSIYLGMNISMVSLDFLGEDKLLFTFRVPGLQHREPGDNGISSERQIRAVVLSLPSGTVQSKAQWTLHDRARYLWMLKDGQFLVRDRDILYGSDDTLALKPLLKFPGPVLTLDLDPEQHYLVTNSTEPLASSGGKNMASSAADDSGADDSSNDDAASRGRIILRIISRSSGQVMLSTRVHSKVYLAADTEGYVGSLRGKADRWDLQLNYFTGGSKSLGEVQSTCMPDISFASDKEVLATTCADNGTSSLFGITIDGRTLWRDLFPEQAIWPIVRMAPNGLRIAREDVLVSRSQPIFGPIDSDNIKGQWVRILDAATGQLAMEAPANPILDGGGNVAISPSGRRVAVLGANGIQIFELPVPPPLPGAPALSAPAVPAKQ